MNHVNTGNNQYCGPAVLSIITGKTVDECASLFAREMGVSNVTSITYQSLIHILERLRYKFTDIDTNTSLYSCMVQVASKPGFYIVGLPKHVGALEVVSSKEIYFCDNHTKEPIRGSSSARMSQHVDKLIKVELKPEPKKISSHIEIVTSSYYQETHYAIRRVNTYEDPHDNSEERLGNFSLKDGELEQILAKLS